MSGPDRVKEVNLFDFKVAVYITGRESTISKTEHDSILQIAQDTCASDVHRAELALQKESWKLDAQATILRD